MYILYLSVKYAHTALYNLGNLSEFKLPPIFLPHILTQEKKYSFITKLSRCTNNERPLPHSLTMDLVSEVIVYVTSFNCS